MKRALRHPATQRLLVHLLTFYGRLVLATCRTRLATPLPPQLTTAPALLALWHQHIVAVPPLTRPSGRPLLVMMSPSRDGRLMRAIAANFGIGAVAGSSHRGGFTAVRQLIRATRPARGQTAPHLLITPDGPRGPARKAKPGATEIARLTNLPLIPMGAWARPAFTINSWDSFRLPLPFATITVAYGAPMQHPTPQQLTKALNALTAKAQAAAGACQG
ncbi:MAG: DUF374 domain-containing protein [Proteobacteria bacterium]|nr:DUF374 domain-containing protein [Pseudomonadota bacterium]